MRFQQTRLLSCIISAVIAVFVFSGISHAQFTVNLTVPVSSPAPAPVGPFTVSATVVNNVNPITRVVFYRNDVPQLTDTTSLYQLPQSPLGQDTYVYKARAYDSMGVGVDSASVKITVTTPNVRTMGTTINGVPTSGPVSPLNTTTDHTTQIQGALDYLYQIGGGTLFFPCKMATPGTPSVYNISDTIRVPSNVTLQSESSEAVVGHCEFRWTDVTYPYQSPPPPPAGCGTVPTHLKNKAMFKLEGGTQGVRFKDMSLRSSTPGLSCYLRADYDYGQIASENTTAIHMDVQSHSGNIRDVILDNVSISFFTYGIKATTAGTDYEIYDVKMRGVTPVANFRQLYIDAKYAYNWDVQNFNLMTMAPLQGAVEILNSGWPGTYTGENPDIKFLQLNCNGNVARTPAFCVKVAKHGGLYFKQLHHEGVNNAILVDDISGGVNPPAKTNPDPIIFESSVATGEFRDPSMKLYLIGNAVFAAPETVTTGDTGRLRFLGAGIKAKVMDCGDVHWDNTVDPNHLFGQLYTHSERYRGSFFADDLGGHKYTLPHTYCSQGDPNFPNANEVGGKYFDSGMISTEASLPYSHVLTNANCGGCNVKTTLEGYFNEGGSIYVDGTFPVYDTIVIPRGRQIIGAPNATFNLMTAGKTLFQINAPVLDNTTFRSSGIVLRDLILNTDIALGSGTAGLAVAGAQSGTVGASSDLHFSGLTIQDFDRGFWVRPDLTCNSDPCPSYAQPMVDGMSFKNSSFLRNQTAVDVLDFNASNWNVMNLLMHSETDLAMGWNQKNGGHQSLQNVECSGLEAHPMSDCIRLSITGTNILGLKKTGYTTNALTVHESIFSHMVIRDSDFRSSTSGPAKVNLLGRAFIVSMNNKYDNFYVANPYSSDPLWRGDKSRITYCGDTYSSGVYSGVATTFDNLITGVETATRVACGSPPPWDDPVTYGGQSTDKPLAGNFYSDTRDDFVIFRPGSPTQFLIKESGGTRTVATSWGLSTDIPMIGHFFPGSRAQIVIWRPSSGDFWMDDLKDPDTPADDSPSAWHWGQTGDIPFIGNFFDESSTGDQDEVGVYRPGDNGVYISNPRSGQYILGSFVPGPFTHIQIGDFMGLHHDQVAFFNNGVWKIYDPISPPPTPPTGYLGAAGDIPVAGKYVAGDCTQMGVWHPATEEFKILDLSTCGSASGTIFWGSNNDYQSNTYPDDILLNMTKDGSIRLPTAYRPTVGEFTQSNSNGQWWVHNAF